MNNRKGDLNQQFTHPKWPCCVVVSFQSVSGDAYRGRDAWQKIGDSSESTQPDASTSPPITEDTLSSRPNVVGSNVLKRPSRKRIARESVLRAPASGQAESIRMNSILANINGLQKSFSLRGRFKRRIKETEEVSHALQESHSQMTESDGPESHEQTTEPDGPKLPPLDLNSNQIRLLRIHPAIMNHDDHRVRIDLHTFALEETPPFVALSYAWGKAKDINKVLVNDYETTVRQNLHDFLLTASQDDSLSGETDWLWIDQLCIDQSNVRERGHQVARMSQIFTRAKKVIIWLGPSYDGSSELMASLQGFEVVGRGRLATQDWPAWDHLTQLDYWNRLWVVQEILLARHIVVMLGCDSITWNALSRCSARYSHVDSLMSPDSGVPSRLHTIRAYYGSTRIPMQWSKAFGVSREALCQIEHDKIFGLLGLVTSASQIQADYALPLPQIYRQVIMCNRENLETTRGKASIPWTADDREISPRSFEDFLNIVSSDAFEYSKDMSQRKAVVRIFS